MEFTEIQQNLKAIAATVTDGCRLVAVSKYHPTSAIQECYNLGQRVFGESHEQELRLKQVSLPKDIQWHFIGHLQTNKVKYIAPYITMIETVDSIKLLREIERQGAKNNRCINVLLELHIAQEETKYGLTKDACRQLLEEGEWREMEHVRICGLMTMASNTDNEEQIRQEFTEAANFFDELKERFFKDDASFSERSWGMSGDYLIAQQCRSTLVRIGTAIFGERQY